MSEADICRELTEAMGYEVITEETSQFDPLGRWEGECCVVDCWVLPGKEDDPESWSGRPNFFTDWKDTGALIEWALKEPTLSLAIGTLFYEPDGRCRVRFYNYQYGDEYELHAGTFQEAIVRAIYAAVKAKK